MFDSNKGSNYMPLWEKVLVIFIVSISVSSLLAVSYRYAEKENGRIKYSDEIVSTINIVSRESWGGSIIPVASDRFQRKPDLVIVMETGGSSCFDPDHCAKRVRHLDDLGYNFLVGADGNVYEGRGWHPGKYANRTLGIGLIGDLNYKIPREGQIEAAKELVEYALRIGRISKGYRLSGSKGEMLLKILRTWDRWTELP